MTDKELNDARLRLHEANAQLYYHLELFGDELADTHGWRGLSGLDAIRYHLMQKHHWTPSQLEAMSLDHLRFAMHGEMQGWTVPSARR